MTLLSRLATRLRRASLPFGIFVVTAVLTLPVSAQPLSQGAGGAEIESPAACSQAQYSLAAIPQQGEEDEIYFGFPPNPDGPTLVGMGLFIDEISDINELDESFSVEAYMELIWCDPREAFDESEIGVTQKILVRNDADAKLDQIWWPTIAIVNEVGGRETKNLELIIAADGTVRYKEKFSVAIENHFELTRFPFDSQELEIEIESFTWDASFVIFHVEADRMGISDEVTPAAWRVGSIDAYVESAQEIRERTAFSEFKMTINVARDAGFYVWKVLMPLLVLVFISWAVFWISVDDLAGRLGVLFTGILTVVAYQLVLSSGLPPVSYFILTDVLIGYSFLLMTLTVVENISLSALHRSGREAQAERMDRIFRWLFPVSYLIGLTLIVVVYLQP